MLSILFIFIYFILSGLLPLNMELNVFYLEVKMININFLGDKGDMDTEEFFRKMNIIKIISIIYTPESSAIIRI